MTLDSAIATISGLEERFADFAAGCVSICELLPRGRAGASNFKDQLARSATSAAANYAEASVPSSQSDFSSRLTIALKELSESRMHLSIIARLDYHMTLKKSSVEGLIEEADKLAAIFRRALGKRRRKNREAEEKPDGSEGVVTILKSAIATARRKKRKATIAKHKTKALAAASRKRPGRPKKKAPAKRKPKIDYFALLLSHFEEAASQCLIGFTPQLEYNCTQMIPLMYDARHEEQAPL